MPSATRTPRPAARTLAAARTLRYLTNAFQRVSFQAEGQAATSYYADLDDLVATSYGAAATLGLAADHAVPPCRSSTGSGISPFFGYSIYGASDLPEGNDPGGVWSDTRVVRSENFTNASSFSVGRRLSDRSTLSADASYRRTDFTDTGAGYAGHAALGCRGTLDLQHDRARGGPHRLRLPQPATTAAGSRTTRTTPCTSSTWAWTTGGRCPSRATRGSPSGRAPPATRRPHRRPAGAPFRDFRYTVIGDAQLVHAIGQSWTAALFISRRVRFYDGFADAFLSNAAGASIGGYLGPRTRLTLAAGTNWGEYGSAEQRQPRHALHAISRRRRSSPSRGTWRCSARYYLLPLLLRRRECRRCPTASRPGTRGRGSA